MAAGSVGSGRGLVQVGGNGRLNAVGIVPAFQGFRGNSHDRLATSWNGPLRAGLPQSAGFLFSREFPVASCQFPVGSDEVTRLGLGRIPEAGPGT